MSNSNANVTSTRIVDLPDSTGQSGQQQSTAYTPINVHPNPYSNNSIVLPQIPMPQPTQGRLNDSISISTTSLEQPSTFQNVPTQKIPSRDIRMDSIDYMQDEEIKPNFIPNHHSPDYIKSEYKEEEEKEIKHHKSSKYRKHLMNDIINEIQTPVLITLIFMLFQLPFLDKFMQTKLFFFNLFKVDGNINNYGILFKSILFGIVYYMFIYIQKYVETL
jgi:hypothetical protein